MEWLSGLASSFGRDLVCGAVKQLRCPRPFNSFVDDLQEVQRKLIAAKDSVNDLVEHDKKQAMKNVQVVHDWLKTEANLLNDHVESLLLLARMNKSCCFGHCPNWIWRYRLAKKLAMRKEQVEEFIEVCREFIQHERVASLPDTRHLPWKKSLQFDSRQSAYEQLIVALKDDKVTMFGLYGMGGCGKTTMAMELMRTAEVENLFDKVLFVPVSSNVEIQKIQDKIASALQFKFPEDGKRERAQRLCERFSRKKKTLVILDDVWQLLDFGEIGIPFGENNKNCKVMIITRSEAVCTSMDCQRMINLSTLTDEEAWELFQKQAHISENTPNTLKDIGRLISNECEGLPVVIAALAGTLKGKDEIDWKIALYRLRSSILVNIEMGLQKPYKCLEASYYNLDSEEAKALLLLCSVYPEDYEIPVEDLTIFAIGLGLVGKVGSFEGARHKVSAAKNKLISSSLLSSSFDDYDEKEYVKMHDLIRDVAHWIASKENKAIKCELKKDMTWECSSIRYLWCKEFPNELDCSCIEFLLLQTKLEISDELFKGMNRLRVLILYYDGKEIGSFSTMSFKSLTNLRCLVLSRWELGDLSSMGYMKKLESLVLFECSFFELPDTVITQLTNLKLLHLSKCAMERDHLEGIGRHLRLEELYYDEVRSSVRSESDFGDGDHAVFFKMFSVPQALRRYRIKFGSRFEDFEISRLNGHRILILSCFDTSNAVVMELAKNSEVLLVANILGGAKNIIPNIFQKGGGGTMNCAWIELCLRYSDEIECLVDTSNHSQEVGTLFSELRKLTIDHMKHFAALYHGVAPNGIFEKLEQLYIERCPMLTCLLTPQAARSLVQLQKLEILYCDGLKHILEDDDWETSRHDDKMVFSKLKLLRIKDCSMLENIIPITFARGLVQLLESLEICGCDKLEYVFGQGTCRDKSPNELKIEIPILEELQLRSNTNMMSIFPKYYYASCPSLHRFQLEGCPEFDIMSIDTFKASSGKLQCVELTNPDEMKYVCACFKNSLNFQNLKTLDIQRYKMLEVVFPASVLRCLPELKCLKISECHELRHIIEEDAENKESSNLVSPQPCFPNLAQLVIKNCNNLKCLFYTSVPACNDLPNLEFFIIEGASELQELIGCGQGLGDDVGKVKVELPKLKLLMLISLSSLCQQGIKLPTPALRLVHNCPKFPLTSSSSMLEEFEGKLSKLEADLERNELHMWEILRIVELHHVFAPEDTRVENPNEEGTACRPIGPDDEHASSSEVHSTLSGVMSVEDKIKESVQKGYISKDNMEANMSSDIGGNGLGVVVVPVTETKTSQSQKMQNDDDSIQEESNSMDQEGEIGVGFKGSIVVHPEACADTSSNHLTIAAELEAFKHYVDMDDAQIALLAEAIAVYPHLWEVLTKFSVCFQAWKSKILADMLFFLRNESATSVTPQREKEFQELCDEAVQLGFDKPWVDELRKRVMVRDPGVEDAKTRLNELLKRRDQLTQELCKIKDEIDNLHNFVGSQKKCFDFL